MARVEQRDMPRFRRGASSLGLRPRRLIPWTLGILRPLNLDEVPNGRGQGGPYACDCENDPKPEMPRAGETKKCANEHDGKVSAIPAVCARANSAARPERRRPIERGRLFKRGIGLENRRLLEV